MGMRLFEYVVLNFPQNNTNAANLLDAWAKSGWRVVGCASWGNGTPTVIMERPVAVASNRKSDGHLYRVHTRADGKPHFIERHVVRSVRPGAVTSYWSTIWSRWTCPVPGKQSVVAAAVLRTVGATA